MYQVKRKVSGDLYDGDNRFEIDENYLVRIKQGMEVTSDTGVVFRTTDLVDFSDTNDREITVYQRNESPRTNVLFSKKVCTTISVRTKNN